MNDLGGGFGNPAHDGARAFRALLDAMARPGRIVTAQAAAAPGLSPAAATVALTLCDPDTPVHLAGEAVRAAEWIGFHCGAPRATQSACTFAFGAWDALTPLAPYPIGTSDYPDRSATLVVEVPTLSGEGPRLTGPGIDGETTLSLPDAGALRANAAGFPLGLDFIFTCGDRLACLPRSTRIGEA
ncbi:phosphonate C-P lyase system protein PhnH [Roseobacter sp. HKCCA0434]|uniref:phosphonate C-P lyase system protein PhnH n=1 Tax=Roseobacter sp. HKCCA0434 TaxID=3079297 RepID=UPI002905CE76|nr:phosphonate C-P lyase system protein PhnH [Roseobacter sp. HKCCA0434]